MTNVSFAELGVSEPLLRALSDANYQIPTPIQAKAIPLLLAGKDIFGIAQTGTGKTAAFAVPILQRLAATPERAGPRGARALVLAPTRELAVQIGEGFRNYGRHLGLRQATVFGGVGLRPQIDALARGVDILVATPGRLLDLMSQGHARLDRASILVLDEGDRMLDMGFVRDVRKIVAALPKRRQSLLFSATMPDDVARLAAEMLHEPVRVEVAPAGVTVEIVDQRVFFVETPRKRALLADLLRDPALARVIVFTRTKHGADRVAEQLGQTGIVAEAMHGNKSQNARQRALMQFRTGRTRVLVATDIAARGIDVADVTHVINYEIPHEPESYVHRVGRTARAGASGIAFSFCDPAERGALRDIERLTRRPISIIADHGHLQGTPVAAGAPKTAAPAPVRLGEKQRRRFRRGQRHRAA